MKTIYTTTLACLCALALFSCKKETVTEIEPNLPANPVGDIEVIFDAGQMVADDMDQTKISHTQSGTTHNFAWEIGDEISMIFFNSPGKAAGVSSADHLLNASARRFTATEENGKFTGHVNTDDLATLGGGGTNLNVFAIHPATDFTLDSEESAADGTFYYYQLSGATIPETQDGTGIPYCYFTSVEPIWSRAYNIFTSASKTFYLSHPLVRFTVTSPKNLTNIEIDASPSAYFVGPVKYRIGNTNQAENAFASPGRRNVASGGTIKKLNINNGGTLPTELWFACRGIQANKEITFTFTAEDGTTCKAKNSLSAAIYSPNIYNLGTINLTAATWK